MHPRSGSQIREDFLRFFEEKEHRRVHSSSLVPANDPTLLFTNAGMNQFKDVFLGAERRTYTRAASSQKCVRAGGKHNDLENVGFTRRHHTFFEMLGNFSFGDYFKREAIAYAWELLTSPDWFAIDKSRLYVTIFEGNASVPRDDEAEQFWIETGVPADRIFGMSAKDNFWQMGDTGPCGPCSEIFYDVGIEAAESGPDGQKIDRPFPQDDQRYVEIWNLVFMQFDRSIDPTTGDGILSPLPKPSIDTGMGLERIACVLQGALSNYQTDLFTPLIQRAHDLTSAGDASVMGRHPERGEGTADRTGTTDFNANQAALSDEKSAASLRIIADHARAATFLISDGVQPANEGRGYVLRKILRRGIRHGRLLGQEQPFMFEMVKAVREEMKSAYPELIETAEHVSKIVLAEEEQFARVLSTAVREMEREFYEHWSATSSKIATFLDSQIEANTRPGIQAAIVSKADEVGDLSREQLKEVFVEFYGSVVGQALFARFENEVHDRKIFPGTTAFYLYETFGLPLDFMIDAARDRDYKFDTAGFESAKSEEQARARASWKGGSQKSAAPVFRELPKTEFEGYTATRIDGARILALVKDGAGVQSLQPGEEGEAVLDATSFYADSGGQVGDVGWLYAADHQTILAEVKGATRPVQGVFAHRIIVRQPLSVGAEVDTVVNTEVRNATMRNHTGTHLLHAALRQVLGTHVKQAGSLVNQSRLRFDFSHFAGIAEPELREVESMINHQVLANTSVQTLVDVPIDVAVNELGAMALFGEKYGDRVRVVKIGDFSTELCGGTHTSATGELGLIKLIGESSVAAGVRRVEAVSGTGALEEFRRGFEVARMAGGGDKPAEALRERLAHNDDEIKRLRRELEQLKLKSAKANMADAASEAIVVHGIRVLARRVDGVDKAQMRDLVDQLRGQLGSGIVVLGAAHDNKVTLIAGVTKDLTGRIHAGKIVSTLAPMVKGKGGGRPDLAEAGGPDAAALDPTLAAVSTVVANLLA
jgi:alanyl-tRNA synthetase